jgi:DNA-binding MarR family transcriptional regulator
VKRWTDPSDRRVVRLGLTEEGNALLDEVFVAAVEYLGPIFERMGDEGREALIRALESFIAAAESVQPQAAQPVK